MRLYCIHLSYDPAMARGISARTQTTKATLGLRELVFEGAFAPGERVPEIELAERLGVSRTPLRLALTTLAHEGLLEPLGGGGFVVRSFSRADVADAIELRGVLEGTAARFAAERLESRDELAALERIAAKLEDALDDLVTYVDLNEAYHSALVELAKSETVTRAIANVVVLPFAAPGALLASHGDLPRSREILVIAQHQHRALIEAIRDGHGTRAEEIAHEHARLARLNLDLVLDDHSALQQIPGAPLLRRAV
jgi:GntR family transcriptional regulator of vanillate catabolism